MFVIRLSLILATNIGNLFQTAKHLRRKINYLVVSSVTKLQIQKRRRSE